MIREFKEFIARGNVLDMAVGIIIGAAFGTIVNSFVSDIVMPPIGLLIGNVDFSNLFVVLKQGKIAGPYATPSEASAAGAVTINYGVFITRIISFLIVAFAIFILVKAVNKLHRKAEPLPPAAAPVTKDCPHCLMSIPIKARKCGHCTAELGLA